MKKNIIPILFLLILDLLWINYYMKNKYKTLVSNIQKSPLLLNYKYALLSYTLMVIGLVIFVLPNIRENNEFNDSLKYGFIFGLVVYGVYDFTAAAVLKDWDINLAIKDILWGSSVYFMSAYVGTLIYNKYFNHEKY